MNSQEFDLAQKTLDVLDVNRRVKKSFEKCDHSKVEKFVVNSLSEQGILTSSDEVKDALIQVTSTSASLNIKGVTETTSHLLENYKQNTTTKNFLSLLENHKILSDEELKEKATHVLNNLSRKILFYTISTILIFIGYASIMLGFLWFSPALIIGAGAFLFIFGFVFLFKSMFNMLDIFSLEDDIKKALKSEDSHSKLLSILAKVGVHKTGKIQKSFSFLGWGPKLDLINPYAQQFVNFEKEDVQLICTIINKNQELEKILNNWKRSLKKITKLELYWLYAIAKQNPC